MCMLLSIVGVDKTMDNAITYNNYLCRVETIINSHLRINVKNENFNILRDSSLKNL